MESKYFPYNLLRKLNSLHICLYICSNIVTPLPVDQRAQGGFFHLYMALIPFTKTAKTYKEQLQKLKDRGLKIS